MTKETWPAADLESIVILMLGGPGQPSLDCSVLSAEIAGQKHQGPCKVLWVSPPPAPRQLFHVSIS